ncbi:MAG: transposase [Candidatus Synechococcus spongiarum 142]|uniref:Transposase n=1 Tax=Candidatus Synechococcus spongiarum 142 TaxID=1608213 RepID=A0A6N3X5N0_9SYNE|nr:MAG: transposase [Candidatus Synechococcus spongiarum 142]
MAHLFWLGEHQLERTKPFFPKARGVSRGDDSRVLSGIIHVLCYGLRWVDAPPADGPYKTLYNRFRCWSHNGAFLLIFSELTRSDGTEPEEEVLMLDATYLKAHRTASSLNKGVRNLD